MPDTEPHLIIAGGLHIDEVATLQSAYVEQASNPVRWQRYVGGVASNAARAAHVHYVQTGNGKVKLHAALGNDDPGLNLRDVVQQQGISVAAQFFDHMPTGRYSAVMTGNGDLVTGLADVQLAEQLRGSAIVDSLKPHDNLLLDANLSSACLHEIVTAAHTQVATIAALTVSPVKALRLIPLAANITLLFCNRREALAMAVTQGIISPNEPADSVELMQLANALTHIGFRQFVLTDGDADIITLSNGCYKRHTPARVAISHNVNGAGDALAGATIAGVTLGLSLEAAVAEHGISMAAKVITGKHLPIAL